MCSLSARSRAVLTSTGVPIVVMRALHPAGVPHEAPRRRHGPARCCSRQRAPPAPRSPGTRRRPAGCGGVEVARGAPAQELPPVGVGHGRHTGVLVAPPAPPQRRRAHRGGRRGAVRARRGRGVSSDARHCDSRSDRRPEVCRVTTRPSGFVAFVACTSHARKRAARRGSASWLRGSQPVPLRRVERRRARDRRSSSQQQRRRGLARYGTCRCCWKSPRGFSSSRAPRGTADGSSDGSWMVWVSWGQGSGRPGGHPRDVPGQGCLGDRGPMGCRAVAVLGAADVQDVLVRTLPVAHRDCAMRPGCSG